MSVLKNVFMLSFLFCATSLMAQPLIGDKVGLDGVIYPLTRVHSGLGIDRVMIDKNNNGIGTGYLSFNNYYRHQSPTYPWYRMGNGSNNGGAIISSTKLGDLQFYPVNSTGGNNTTVSNADMKKRMVLKISHNNEDQGHGYIQINDGFRAVHIGEVSGAPFDGNGYMGFNVQKDEATSRWKTGTDGVKNGGNVLYSTMDGTFVVSALGSLGAAAANYTDEQIKQRAVLKVDKNGVLNTREIEVCATTWCDYVFAEDYELRPLSEVREFININKHLPEVPSEKEVLNDGINLGDMNVIFIKKIEELTLYILEQEEKIKALEEKLK